MSTTVKYELRETKAGEPIPKAHRSYLIGIEPPVQLAADATRQIMMHGSLAPAEQRPCKEIADAKVLGASTESAGLYVRLQDIDDPLDLPIVETLMKERLTDVLGGLGIHDIRFVKVDPEPVAAA